MCHGTINHYSMQVAELNVTDSILNTTKFNISYFNSNSDVFVSSSAVPTRTSCINGTCDEYVGNVSSFQCQPISVNISAVNALGEGPPLQQIINGIIIINSHDS